jgi:hypothetical protein
MNATLTDVVPGAASWVFSPAFLWQVMDGRHRALLRRLGVTAVLGRETTVVEMYDRVYAEMLRSYRVEYVYKNEIIRKLSLVRHNPKISAVVLEQHVDDHKTRLDLVVVNDTTTAYEVKTAHDSLARLERQTAESLRVFDRVVVACADTHLKKVWSVVDNRVGIVRFGPRGGLSIERRPIDNAGHVDPFAIFSVLHKTERERTVRERFGPPPGLFPLDDHEWHRERFGRFTPAEAHVILLTALRKRHIRPDRNAIPEDLRPAMTHLYYKLTSAERVRLLTPKILERSIG